MKTLYHELEKLFTGINFIDPGIRHSRSGNNKLCSENNVPSIKSA